jgi:hypothetical protein
VRLPAAILLLVRDCYAEGPAAAVFALANKHYYCPGSLVPQQQFARHRSVTVLQVHKGIQTGQQPFTVGELDSVASSHNQVYFRMIYLLLQHLRHLVQLPGIQGQLPHNLVKDLWGHTV